MRELTNYEVAQAVGEQEWWDEWNNWKEFAFGYYGPLAHRVRIVVVGDDYGGDEIDSFEVADKDGNVLSPDPTAPVMCGKLGEYKAEEVKYAVECEVKEALAEMDVPDEDCEFILDEPPTRRFAKIFGEERLEVAEVRAE